MVAPLQTVSGIESADGSNVCIFGEGACRRSRSECIKDHAEPVLCGLRGTLCYDVDSVYNLRASFT